MPATRSAAAETSASPEGAILRAEGLVKHFPIRSGAFGRQTGSIHAVDDVTIELPEGQTLGLVGESGCGKTTVGRLLARLEEPTAGSVTLQGRDLTQASERELRRLRRDIQVVFQDPYGSLNPRLTVGRNVSEAMRLQRTLPRKEWRDNVVRLLEQVGLRAEYINRLPAEFSGGQRQRICIARALATNPKVLVLDEPVSALDVSVQAQVLNLLSELQSDRKLSYVFISHDLSVVRHLSSRVAVMYLGKIVEVASRSQLFTSALHPYSYALLSAVPRPDPRARHSRRRIVLQGDVPNPAAPPSGCRFRTRCWRAKELCAQAEPALSPGAGGHAVACHFPMNADQ